MTGYRPMTLTNLAGRLTRTPEGKVRWKLMWEFLEEYRWEPAGIQLTLLDDEPPPTGTNAGTRYWRRWLSTWPPGTARPAGMGGATGTARAVVPRRTGDPAGRGAGMGASAFREHGVYHSARDLEAVTGHDAAR